jgi:hypothetical protein
MKTPSSTSIAPNGNISKARIWPGAKPRVTVNTTMKTVIAIRPKMKVVTIALMSRSGFISRVVASWLSGLSFAPQWLQ